MLIFHTSTKGWEMPYFCDVIEAINDVVIIIYCYSYFFLYQDVCFVDENFLKFINLIIYSFSITDIFQAEFCF